VTRTPCATPPYWQDVTSIITTTKTTYVKATAHAQHDDGYPATPSKDAIVLPPPAQISPVKAHVETKPDHPYLEQPASPNKPYNPAAPAVSSAPAVPSTPAKPVIPSKDYDTPASPVVPPPKGYAADDSWPLAGATPSGKNAPTSTYGAKPSQFTGGASSNAVVGGSFLTVAIGAAVAMLM
jgi:hypothetical protein